MKKLPIEQQQYFQGYWRAMCNFGHYLDGKQIIGEEDLPIDMCMVEEMKRHGLDTNSAIKHLDALKEGS